MNQLFYYLNNSFEIENYFSQSIYHRFLINVSTVQCITFIRLQDQRKMPRQIGGASFRTIVRSAHYLFPCPYVDYANGTYDVICQTYCGLKYEITLILTYLDFGAFRWDGIFINDTLWHEQILPSGHEPVNKKFYVGWYRDSNQQDWKWIRGHKETLTHGELRACIRKQISKVEMLGECHLQFAFQYLHLLFKKLTPDIVTYKVLPGPFLGYAFKRAAFMLHEDDIPGFVSDKNSMLPWVRITSRGRNMSKLLPELHELRLKFKKQLINIKKQSPTKNYYNLFKNKLVIQFGQWDLSFRHIRYFVKNTLPAFDALLQSFRADPDLSQVKIIVWGPPAVKEINYTRSNSSEKYYLLNNALLGAANELLKETVRQYDNVIYLDYFATVFCRDNETLDPSHYLRSDIINKRRTFMHGNVGMIVAKLLLEMTCSDSVT